MHCTVVLVISLYQEMTYHGLISIFVEHVGNEIFV